MSSIFTDSQKNEIASLLDNVHDTFARPIYWVKQNQIVTINTGEGFNPSYDEQASVTTTTVVVSGLASGRILYLEPNSNSRYPIPESPITLDRSWVRLKVDAQSYETIKTAEQIHLDNKKFEIKTASKNIGPFDTRYCSFLLREIK